MSARVLTQKAIDTECPECGHLLWLVNELGKEDEEPLDCCLACGYLK